MLILWGDQDPFIKPNYADRYGAREVEHFPQYGHWIAVEAPDMVTARLVKFFA
jgi:pimeloyl-ACP methyl ester carboxylesterase